MKLYKEALSYSEQEKKMDAWHSGARGANVSAMSDDKLKMNHDICIKKNYNQEAEDLFKEALKRNLDWALKIKQDRIIEKYTLTEMDFHPADLRFIKDHLKDEDPFEVIWRNGSWYYKQQILSIIWLLAIGETTLAARLKDFLNKFGEVDTETLKIIIRNALNDQAIKNRINTIPLLLDESIDEDLELNEKVEKHDTLNPKLWNEDNTLKPEVSEKINQIVQEFIEGLAEDEIKIDINDIILVGSNCSYNYNEGSDLDIHIRANIKTLDCPEQHLDKLYSAYRSLFNKKFDIDFYGIPVELYVETGELNTISNGIYSVKNQSWIKEPVQADIPEVNEEAINEQVGEWTAKYNQVVENKNIDEIDKFIEDVYNLRKTAMEKGNEFSESNLVFKELRNAGYLDNLKELKAELKGQEMSLESLNEAKEEKTISKDDIRKIVEDATTKLSKITIFEADDFSFDLNIVDQEEKDYGGNDYYTFWVQGGLNGSGNWKDYLKDLAILFETLEDETGLEPYIIKENTDCADDLFTVQVGLTKKDENTELTESPSQEIGDTYNKLLKRCSIKLESLTENIPSPDGNETGKKRVIFKRKGKLCVADYDKYANGTLGTFDVERAAFDTPEETIDYECKYGPYKKSDFVVDIDENLTESSLGKGTYNIDDNNIIEYGWEKPNTFYVGKFYHVGDEPGWRTDFIKYYPSEEAAKKAYMNYIKNYKLATDEYPVEIDEMLYEMISEKDRYEYRNKITRLAKGNQPIIQNNGLFQIYNVKQSDFNNIVAVLRRQDFIEDCHAVPGRYDFSKPPVVPGQLPDRYYTITGKIRLN